MREAAVRKLDGDEAAACSPARAQIRRLTLTEFRSYENLDLELDGRSLVLTGPNGAGKTNLLEALSLLGPGRGLRAARLDELPRLDGAGRWAVSVRLDSGSGEVALGVGANEFGDRRICRIDGSSVSGPAAFAERLRFVWLTPAQDRLFLDGPGERRRFLDRLATAQDAAHAAAAAAYETAMGQRQKLLDDGSRDGAWLSALELQMAEAGVAVAAARRDVVSALAAAAVEDGAFPAADISLEGALEAALAYAPAAEVEEEFQRTLGDSRRADAEAGRALHGPHRSDLLVSRRANGRAARLCSTGEQKALLIGLVLAGARGLSLKPGGAPLILLLDEVAAHLDEDRRDALFSILDELGFQCFMTGADRALFRAWGPRAQSFDVRDGAVREI